MNEDKQTRGPAPRPCESCPYRRDVPAGIWAASQYKKLPEYDLPTPYQPGKLFLCHQTEFESSQRRVCAGWAAVHDMGESLGLRLALAFGNVSLKTCEEIRAYVSPIPMFSNGAEAAEHGLSGIYEPSPGADRIRKKIISSRNDIKLG